MGGIPYWLPEEKVIEILECVGEFKVRHFNLIRDKETGQSKGYGFAVFVDRSVVDTVCNTVHGLPLNDKTLTVRRANEKKAKDGAVPAGAAGKNAEMPAPGASRVIELVREWMGVG